MVFENKDRPKRAAFYAYAELFFFLIGEPRPGTRAGPIPTNN
jgi:hypothetical protein